jgi:hypothetical protein
LKIALQFLQKIGSPVAISALFLSVLKAILKTLVSISVLNFLAGFFLDALFFWTEILYSSASSSSHERLRFPSSSSEEMFSIDLFLSSSSDAES